MNSEPITNSVLLLLRAELGFPVGDARPPTLTTGEAADGRYAILWPTPGGRQQVTSLAGVIDDGAFVHQVDYSGKTRAQAQILLDKGRRILTGWTGGAYTHTLGPSAEDIASGLGGWVVISRTVIQPGQPERETDQLWTAHELYEFAVAPA